MSARRVTDQDLQWLVDRINEATHSPMTPWGVGQANVGNYHLAYGFGGVTLHRILSVAGTVGTPLSAGFKSRRELYGQLEAFLAGCEIV